MRRVDKLAEKAKDIAEKLEMSARVVKLRDNIDPGNLTKPEIERLRRSYMDKPLNARNTNKKDEFMLQLTNEGYIIADI